MIKNNPKNLKMVCIDDFAIKKWEKYGTIMIDIETRTIVDMIESRKREEVSEWLKTYPNVQIVSRDGSITYAKAISDSNRNIIQVGDRFHLIKNITDYGSEYLKKYLKLKIRIPKAEEQKEEVKREKTKELVTLAKKIEKAVELHEKGVLRTQICNELNINSRTLNKFLAMSQSEREKTLKSKTQKRHEDTVRRKEEMVQCVREMYQNGFSQRRISRELNLEWKTVKKYLDPDFNSVHKMYGRKKKSILDGYHETIEHLLREGLKCREIEEQLRQKGYSGSSSLIRMHISKVKRRKQESYINQYKAVSYDFLSRNHIIKLLYKPLKDIKGLTQEMYTQFQLHYPKAAGIIELISEFKDILKSSAINLLEPWIQKAQALDSDEISSFVNGVQRDKNAVVNAIMLPYSNGLAEGKINKLKTIKRVMYGRCSFDTLKTKVLLLK